MKKLSDSISVIVILASILTGCYSGTKVMSSTQQLTLKVINK